MPWVVLAQGRAVQSEGQRRTVDSFRSALGRIQPVSFVADPAAGGRKTTKLKAKNTARGRPSKSRAFQRDAKEKPLRPIKKSGK